MVGGNSGLNSLPEILAGAGLNFFILDCDRLVNHKPGGVHEMDRLLARLLRVVAGCQKKVMMVAGVAGKGSGHRLVKKVMAKFNVFVAGVFSASFC
jgi:folylpolyglutamate synthase/dihydropteroate synthase